MNAPGRVCPTHYHYRPHLLARPTELTAETLYVVGGLYGNRLALEAILSLRDREVAGATLVFNGDFNWFNVDPAGFEAVNEAVLEHIALRGNVETELADPHTDAGCGCGYPLWVSDAEVERSNQIMARLHETARPFPGVRARLGALPMYLSAAVGGLPIGIVHGDAESLAGWAFSHAALSQPGQPRRVREYFQQARVRIFACSHTCLPVAHDLELPTGKGVLINNGAAGMPNFHNTRYGVITRIGVRPARGIESIYGTCVDGVYVDALPVHYDHSAWRRSFLANWPPGSPAYASYFRRIIRGPVYERAQALLAGDGWTRDTRGNADEAAGAPCCSDPGLLPCLSG